jgi:hypothetical protein
VKADVIQEVDEEEWEPGNDSDVDTDDDYEIVYVTDSEDSDD